MSRHNSLFRYFRHLAARFVDYLTAKPLEPGERQWVSGWLEASTMELWERQSRADQRHALGVAQVVAESTSRREVVGAALVHDVGKVASNLGVFGRVGATLAVQVFGYERVAKQTKFRRWNQYLHHPEIGATLLEAHGAVPELVVWAREHQRQHPEAPCFSAEEVALLVEADDD